MGLIALLSPLALAGCPAPLGVTAAGYGIDGVAYATEGQSTTDMAITGIQGENCALFRVIQGKPVCRPFTPEEQAQLARNRAAIKRGHPEVVLMTQGQDLDQLAKNEVTLKADKDAAGKGGGAGEDARMAASASSAGQAQPATSKPAAQPAIQVRTASLPAPAARPASAGAKTVTPAVRPGDVYLVLGSFSSRDGAEHARAVYARRQPGLVLAVLDGPSFHRVASGPLSPERVPAMRARVAQGLGIRQSWTMPACPSGGGPGCAAMARLGVATATQLAAR